MHQPKKSRLQPALQRCYKKNPSCVPVGWTTLGEYVGVDVEVPAEGGEVRHAGPHLTKIVTQRAKAEQIGQCYYLLRCIDYTGQKRNVLFLINDQDRAFQIDVSASLDRDLKIIYHFGIFNSGTRSSRT